MADCGNSSTTVLDYQQTLDQLLMRYSKEGKTVFRKVHNLSDFAGYAGIYVLCIPSVRGYYIGKSKDIARRIPQHFKHPKTQFDHSFSLEDIHEIYVLHCSRDVLDLAEVDCIASIPKKFLLNRMAGGPTILFIDSVEYDAKRCMLNNELLQDLIQGSEIARKLDEWNIRQKAEITYIRKAATKIKKTKLSAVTYELSLAAINYEGEMIEYVPREFRTPEFCLKALGWASDTHKVLQFVPESARNKEICIYALQFSNNPIETLKIVPKNLLTEEFAEELVSLRRSLLNKLPVELQTERVIRAAEPKKRKKKAILD